MRLNSGMYPPAIKNYLKLVPSVTIYLYLVMIHPIMLYNILNHSKERIERITARRNPMERHVSRRDDYLRQFYLEQIEWQPSTQDRSKKPAVRTP